MIRWYFDLLMWKYLTVTWTSCNLLWASCLQVFEMIFGAVYIKSRLDWRGRELKKIITLKTLDLDNNFSQCIFFPLLLHWCQIFLAHSLSFHFWLISVALFSSTWPSAQLVSPYLLSFLKFEMYHFLFFLVKPYRIIYRRSTHKRVDVFIHLHGRPTAGRTCSFDKYTTNYREFYNFVKLPKRKKTRMKHPIESFVDETTRYVRITRLIWFWRLAVLANFV